LTGYAILGGWLEAWVGFAGRTPEMEPTSATPRWQKEVLVSALVDDSVERKLKLVYYPIYATRTSPGACCIDLLLDDGRTVSGKAHSYFHALLELRRQLEEMGIQLLCWGAKSDVWPTGMETSMGAGDVVSRRKPTGAPISHESIFSRIAKEEVSTVSKQEAFFRGILQTMKGKGTV